MKSQCHRLDGKFALVTGASRGIGRAIAERFAAEGATVAINYVGSPTTAEESLESVRRASVENGFGDRPHRTVQADVSDAAAVAAMFEDVLGAWKRLDILVNNAGIMSEAPSESYSLDEYERIIGVNLTGALLCAQGALKHFLARQGGGVILNCSSVHQLIPKPGFIAYSASKGGLGNLTRTLALEYAERGIRVNAVGPGAIRTDINDAWIHDPKRKREVESHIPMGRSGAPEEMAAVFAFLASDDASYITGQTIYACGGLTLYGEFRTNWAS
jgi:glucose 1-dehydrogenase